MSGLLGRKIGMTKMFDTDGRIVPVTVVQAGPCYVAQIKSKKTDGYDAVQLGFGHRKPKKTNKPLEGHFKKAQVDAARILKEFEPFTDRELKVGDEIKADIFQVGDSVKVSGTSKGRGFSGVVKRHGFHGGPLTHGQSDRLRAPGSLGQSSDPSRVFKGVKMPGRMGNKRVSVLGLSVVKVDSEKNLIFIKGAVPGARNSFLEIHRA
jgi:large subunit ribosomal protein L3